VRGLSTLRVKESDRLAAMHAELARIGCASDVADDAIDVRPAGVPRPAGVVIHTYRDHRMAMCFAAIGLRTGGILVQDPGCVAKSYPGFWSDLARLRDGTGAA
jgi:3-phosphoshikimate 1-carboxyvinyltransferase